MHLWEFHGVMSDSQSVSVNYQCSYDGETLSNLH